jgi:HPt (histidine-containing phosphotransfer) domain-containing protein
MRQFLLTKFIERSSELAQAMQESLKSSDYSNLSNLAHRMKSAALTVGAQVLAQRTQALETLARAQLGPTSQALIETPLETLFETLVHDLELTQRAIGASTQAQPPPDTTHR